MPSRRVPEAAAICHYCLLCGNWVGGESFAFGQ
jgi:hypothetical protein